MNKTMSALACAALLAGCSSGDDDGGSFPNPGEPNETLATATALPLGTLIAATIANDADYDFYKFTLATAATVHIQTFDGGGTSCDLANDSVDPFVEVYNSSQSWVTLSDDSGINWCEDFTVFLPAGTNYVAISGFPPYPFVYTLVVTQL
jgi:hypothetical protein